MWSAESKSYVWRAESNRHESDGVWTVLVVMDHTVFALFAFYWFLNGLFALLHAPLGLYVTHTSDWPWSVDCGKGRAWGFSAATSSRCRDIKAALVFDLHSSFRLSVDLLENFCRSFPDSSAVHVPSQLNSNGARYQGKARRQRRRIGAPRGTQ